MMTQDDIALARDIIQKATSTHSSEPIRCVNTDLLIAKLILDAAKMRKELERLHSIIDKP